MERSLQTSDGNKSLLAPEDQAALEQMRQMNDRPTVTMFDMIKFKDSEKKIEGLTRGNWFVESWDGVEKKKSFRDIGPNPEIVVLARFYTYSYYKDGVGLVAWTTDIGGFGDANMVAVYRKGDGGKAVEEFVGPYPELKKFMAHKYTIEVQGRTEKLMTFQNLLYVLFEGQVYRMFVSNASAAGIAPGAKGPDFKDPQPKSLIAFVDSTRGSALCESVCRLGAWFKDDVEQPYYVRTFENAGVTPLETLQDAVRKSKEVVMAAMRLNKDLSERKNIGDLRSEVGGDVIDAYAHELPVLD